MKACQAIFFCLLALTLIAASVPSCFAVDAVEASYKIDEAESNLNLAFATVYQAENAGADVGDLLAQLKTAGDFLSRAYAEFRGGNYESAFALAANCSDTVEGLASEAVYLMAKAGREETDKLIITVAVSGVGLVLLMVLGIAGWSLLEKRYWQRVQKLRPEVEQSP